MASSAYKIPNERTGNDLVGTRPSKHMVSEQHERNKANKTIPAKRSVHLDNKRCNGENM